VDIGEQIRFIERNLDAVESRASASFKDSKWDREEKANLRAVLESIRLVPKLMKVVEAAMFFDKHFGPDGNWRAPPNETPPYTEWAPNMAKLKAALAALDAGEGGK